MGPLLRTLIGLSKGGCGMLQELTLPFGDHGRMNVKAFGDLDEGLFTSNGF